MLRLYSSTEKFDTVFTVLLFVLFAIMAGLLILIGAGQYQVSTDSMNHNYEIRTASSFLTEKIHQNDSISSVSVKNDMLVFSETIEDSAYLTYVYYYDGFLCELFTASDADFTPEAGQQILSLGGFSAAQVEDGLFLIRFTDSDGGIHSEYLHTHAV